MEHYKIEILSTADQDIIEIARYISEELKNPTAAETLIDKIYDAAESLSGFPYSHMLYYPVDKSKSLNMNIEKYLSIIICCFIMLMKNQNRLLFLA